MNFYPTIQEAETILKTDDFKTIPISYSIDAKKDATDIYKVLKNISRNVFILESARYDKTWGRYTFLGFDPKLEITCKDRTVKINSGTSLTFEDKSPHEYIRQIIEENKSPQISSLPTFTGGLVGYFSYEFINYSEPNTVSDTMDEEGFNDVDLMLFDKLIAIDNLEQKIVFIVNIKTDDLKSNYNKGILDLKQLENLVINGEFVNEEKGKLLEPLTPLFDETRYSKMVENAKQSILDGDISQVVLSNRLSAKYTGSLFNTYCTLRKENPSPYMFYFSSSDIEIAGASPETLVKLENKKISTFPLAGTKRRGKTPEEDKELEIELLGDQKECSEHNMLVDLGLYDLGKISEPSSLKVAKYMSIERFSHVMHIGSTVQGTIRGDKDALDAIDAVLPAGTLSGAPKLKACEIINRLENNRRGIYGGAIGYIDFSGNMDTCISIRLAFKKNGKVFVRSGAGIVKDSIPKKEYEECINKARAVVEALEEV
ncbi:anthranilate synthase component I family protein [Tissierella creatinophila]|uniref:Anthranilate synthase component 1 n=1 Tax=Tissierella creatinophila DSM 6911 TaxID=1123403 RepID=A0A1U7M7I7_TISCR|nr:anthranilate synthase component I family protein [Tissierella creatinophila]OLS03251.1 anthranilate synthase component 1 [Tissierella creatinophila DSM 6911]